MFRRKRDTRELAPGPERHSKLDRDQSHGALVKAQFYKPGPVLWWNQLRREVRSAARALARDRAFAAFAVLLITLGAGLVSTMFALVDAVALRKLDVPDPDSLFHVVALREGGQAGLRFSLFERLRENLDLADSMFATSNTFVPVTYEGRTETAFTEFMTGDYYRTMGARPLLGRTLTPADDGPFVVISDAYWRRIGKDPAVIGKTLRAGAVPLTIVGVVPASSHEFWRFSRTDMVVPFRIGMVFEVTPPEREYRYNVYVRARLRKGFTFTEVQHRLEALWPRLLAQTIPPGEDLEAWTRTAGAQVRVLPGSRGYLAMGDSLRRATTALFVLAGLVSLAMCSNLASLLLSRGLSRHREYAVRMALGATRGDLVRHALAEVLVLSVVGGGGAILLATWLTRLSSGLLPSLGTLDLDYGVRVDGRVMAFAVVAALITGGAAQLLPALRLSSVNVGDSLRLGRTISARLGSRKAILAVQVSAAIVLVSGSVLFVRTLQLLARVNGGFRTEGVLIVELAGRTPFPEAGPEFFHELLRRVRAIPSVTAAGLADGIPMDTTSMQETTITGSHSGTSLEVKSDSGCSWPGFFETLKIPMVAGRDFRESDRDAVVLTRELARTLFPGMEPVGRYVRVGKAPQIQNYQVIGVIGDVRFRSLRQQHARMFFAPCRQVWKAPQTRNAMALAVRAEGVPAEVAAAVRREIDAMGKQAVFKVISFDALVARSNQNESMLATIATGFGGFTLLLTCAGVYALVDLTVTARRRELGIRMALGANGRMILQFMLKDVARVIGFGTCMGLVVALVVSRLYRAFLFGVPEFEPLLMSTSLAIVALFTLVAALVPALRAARLEPGLVLRLGE